MLLYVLVYLILYKVFHLENFLFADDEKPASEAKPRGRRAHDLWSPEDKNAFYEALNEYGKDFDSIQQHIALKAKKRGEQVIKNRDQARHFYHRTWQKISKHLRFPEGKLNGF